MAEETEYLNAISCCFYVLGTLFYSDDGLFIQFWSKMNIFEFV